MGGRICPYLPCPTKVTGGGCDTGAGACPPGSRPVCSALCLWLGCYQSVLGKDSTRDSSQSDFRVRSAPLIKLRAARREDKQSSLSPINGPSPPRAAQALAAGRSRTQGPARTGCEGNTLPERSATRRTLSCPHFTGPLWEAAGALSNPHPSPAMPGSRLPNHQILTHFTRQLLPSKEPGTRWPLWQGHPGDPQQPT